VFHQDLNADGMIGLTTTAIESSGSISLTEVGNNFYFYNSGGSGPSFNFGGAPFVAGEFGAWTPIGGEQIAGGGYDIAFKVPGADQYTVWTTDSNGNFLSALVGTVSGTSSALESLESVFHQDLNGDGVIGLTTTAIESSGSTSLTEVGNNFYFYNSGGSGPSFNFGGAPFVAGEFGAWTPIGAEQISSGGYEIAWKVPGADQYTVWTTDSNGNFLSALFGTVSGTSSALESQEPLFHQDLSGDGLIGLPSFINPAFAATDIQILANYSLDNFKFADDGSGGSAVYAQVGSSQPPVLGNVASIQVAGNNGTAAGQDIFVFAPNFGHVILANFASATDSIQIGKTAFANIGELFATTHNYSQGNAVITDAAHDAITIQNATTAQLLAVHWDFHFV
jgi:hypothetical protein